MGASQLVEPQWPHPGPTARVAFVGEAPRHEELEAGLPLVGPSGRTMSQMLRTAGLGRAGDPPAGFYPDLASRGLRPMLWHRSEFFWTNVFNFQLPDNDIKHLCAPAPEAKLWPDYHLDRIQNAGYLRPEHIPSLLRLQTELVAVRPTLIVPLGGTALWAFTGNSDIMQQRGAVAKAAYISPGTKLLPTLHPDHVIHSHKMFSVVVGDLEKAWREAQFPDIRLPKREIWIDPTLADIREFRRRYITPGTLTAADIETAAGQITCISFAPSAERAIVIPFVDYRKPNRSYWPTAGDELAALEEVEAICADPEIPMMFQNGPYDIYWIWRYWGIHVNNYLHDTRLMHHALYPELPKSLQFMGATYGNNFAWKSMREKKSDKRDE